MLKIYDCPLNLPLLLIAGPFLSVKLAGFGEIEETSAKKLTEVLEDFFDRGTG